MSTRKKTEQHETATRLKWLYKALKLTEEDAKALGTILVSAGTDAEGWLTKLVREKIEQAKLAKTLEKTRQPLLGKTSARQYAQRIVKILTECEEQNRARECIWLFLDYENDNVSLTATYPTSRKGRVILSAENRDEWKTLSGKYTIDSVTACLLGFARPP